MVAPVTAGRPRGTTQVVTRGTTNDWYEVVYGDESDEMKVRWGWCWCDDDGDVDGAGGRLTSGPGCKGDVGEGGVVVEEMEAMKVRSGLDRDGGDRVDWQQSVERQRLPRRKNIPVAGNAIGALDNFLERVCVLGQVICE
ncbi:hypothetical protein Tco_0327135 [Tanacetum coccineum]